MVVKQSTTVYAGGFSPLQLRYNVASHHKVVPYLEIARRNSRIVRAVAGKYAYCFNFLDQSAAAGRCQFKIAQEQGTPITTGVRYQHISNAGLGNHNPGINSMFFFVGANWWRK